MGIDFKNELNEQQYLAVTSNAKYLRIIAGAGTGKTRTLTYRLASLIMRNEVSPNKIVAITFTNKAANEMKERTISLLKERNISYSSLPIIKTFHSFCLMFLRRELDGFFSFFTPNFQVVSEDDIKKIHKELAASLNLKVTDDPYKRIKSYIDSWKTNGLLPSEVNISKMDPEFYTKNDALKIYIKYQEKLQANNLVDFDDILIYTREILSNNENLRRKYSYYYQAFMVDEFQDTNDLQYDIVKLFMNENTQLCVVGDPDQTIYTWRGANNSLIKNRLKVDFPSLQTIVLDLNYRSTQNILDVANLVINNNTNREKKVLKSFNNIEGKPVELITSSSRDEEAKKIVSKILSLHVHNDVSYSDIAIIYRSNFLSNRFEKTLMQNGVPYKMYSGFSFYQREEVLTGLAYLKILINPADEYSFKRALFTPSRKIGDKTYLELIKGLKDENVTTYVFNNLNSLNIGPSVKAKLYLLAEAYKTCLKTVNDNNLSIDEKANAIDVYFNRVGLFEYYENVDKIEQANSGVSDNSRVQNLHELVSEYHDFLKENFENPQEGMTADLVSFIANASLMSNQDDIENTNKVSLMTGHTSKGLEFPYVFIVGMVEGFFPSSKSILSTSENPLQEERRLCYVMMTRAKKQLFLSTYNDSDYSGNDLVPSRFLKEAGIKVNLNGLGNTYNSRKKSFIDEIVYNDDSYIPVSFNKEPSKGFVKKLTPSNNVSNNTSNDEYKVNDKVEHISFGIGVVTKVEDKFIYVQFKEPYGDKKLVKGFKAFKKVN